METVLGKQEYKHYKDLVLKRRRVTAVAAPTPATHAIATLWKTDGRNSVSESFGAKKQGFTHSEEHNHSSNTFLGQNSVRHSRIYYYTVLFFLPPSIVNGLRTWLKTETKNGLRD